MGFSNTRWTEAKLRQRIAEGRGQGEGEHYLPWLTVQNVKSRGRVTRIYGQTTKRVHHLLTDSQLYYFYLLEWDEQVVDIREHYPLLDIVDVLDTCDEALVQRMIDKKTGIPHVLTTTFLVTMRNERGEIEYVARNLRGMEGLERRASLERYEVIRRYWQMKGVDWGIVTPKEIPIQKAKNIGWALTSLHLRNEFSSEEMFQTYQQALQDLLITYSGAIRHGLQAFERMHQLEDGMGLFLFKYLIATKQIQLFMDEAIDVNRTPKELGLTCPQLAGGASHCHVLNRQHAIAGA